MPGSPVRASSSNPSVRSATIAFSMTALPRVCFSSSWSRGPIVLANLVKQQVQRGVSFPALHWRQTICTFSLEDLRQSLAFVPYCVEERSVKAQRIRGRSPRRLTRVSNEVCNSSAPRFCIYGYRPLAHMTWVDPSARRSHRRVQSFGEGPRPSLKDGVRGVKPPTLPGIPPRQPGVPPPKAGNIPAGWGYPKARLGIFPPAANNPEGAGEYSRRPGTFLWGPAGINHSGERSRPPAVMFQASGGHVPGRRGISLGFRGTLPRNGSP